MRGSIQSILRVLALVMLLLGVVQGAVMFSAIRSMNTALAAMEAALSSFPSADGGAAQPAPDIFGTFSQGWDFLILLWCIATGAVQAAALWAAARALDILESQDSALTLLARLALAERPMSGDPSSSQQSGCPIETEGYTRATR